MLGFSTRRSRPRLFCVFAAVLLGAAFAPGSALAQSDSTASRVDRLEAELSALRALVGNLQSTAGAQPNAMPQEGFAPDPGAQAFDPQSDLGARVSALETQIGALTSQLEQIGRQMAALESRLTGAAQPLVPLPQESMPPSDSVPPSNSAPPDSMPQSITPPARQGYAPAPSSDSSWAVADASNTSQPRWFGPKPGAEPQAPLPSEQPHSLTPPGEAAVGSISGVEKPETVMAAVPSSGAKELYAQGRRQLAQHDFKAAEDSFSQLIETHPDDALAGSAQYWLGETYYVRGQHKKAADAFLKGYKTHKSSKKAPDTLLKLGMSLAALGQKEAACSTFGELRAKFPRAPEDVRDQAKTERKKTGC